MSSKLPFRANVVLFLWLLPAFGFGHSGAQNPLDTVASRLLVEVIEEADGNLETVPEASDVLAFKGQIEFQRAKLEEVCASCKRALELGPDTARAPRFNLASMSCPSQSTRSPSGRAST